MICCVDWNGLFLAYFSKAVIKTNKNKPEITQDKGLTFSLSYTKVMKEGPLLFSLKFQ